jgi:hypothetical protein
MGKKDKSGYYQVLYLYPEEGAHETERRVNFDPKIYAEIRERAGLSESSPSQVDGEEQGRRVMINPDQYFEGVPLVAWEFHIGGYQPAQKWLKDRKGRALSFDDVMHYQKIIKILTETDRIMKEIKSPL